MGENAVLPKGLIQKLCTHMYNRHSCFTTPVWAELLFYFEKCWLLLDWFLLAERALELICVVSSLFHWVKLGNKKNYKRDDKGGIFHERF